jgi:cobalt-zinc-cadmium efflux system outer membrane protein
MLSPFSAKLKNSFMIASLGWLLAIPGLAAPLSLEQVLTATQTHFPPLQAARQKRAIAAAKLLAAEGAFDTKWKAKGEGVPLGYYQQGNMDVFLEQPTPFWGMTVLSGYRLGLGNFAVYDGKKATNALGELRAGLVLPLLRDRDIDERRAKIGQAELDLVAADLDIRAKELKFAADALKSYWSWVAAGVSMQLIDQQLQLALTRNAGIVRSVQLGELAPIELQENQRAILNRQAKQLEGMRKLQETQIQLSLYVRQEDGLPWRPSSEALPPQFPELPSPPPWQETLLDTAYRHRPELLALDVQWEQLDLALRLAKNQLNPALDLRFDASQDLGAGEKSREPFELSVGLQWDFPLQLRKAQGNLDELQAVQLQLAAEIRFQREQIKAELQDRHSAYQMAWERLATLRREVEVARQLEAAERQSFHLGNSSLLVVNLREQNTLDASLRELEAMAEAHKSRWLYLVSLGLLPQDKAPTGGG